MKLELKKVHTPKDLCLSCVTIVGGGVLYALNPALGFLLLCSGVLMLLFCKMGWRTDPNGPVLTKKSLELSAACRNELIEQLRSDSSGPLDLPPAGQGAAIRLEVYYNVKCGIAYAQLYDFKDYSYVEATDAIKLPRGKSKELISYLCGG